MYIVFFKYDEVTYNEIVLFLIQYSYFWLTVFALLKLC